jgi:hypothetical protein
MIAITAANVVENWPWSKRDEDRPEEQTARIAAKSIGLEVTRLAIILAMLAANLKDDATTFWYLLGVYVVGFLAQSIVQSRHSHRTMSASRQRRGSS